MHRSLFGTSGATIKIMEIPEFGEILDCTRRLRCKYQKSFVLQSGTHTRHMYISVNKDKEIKKIYKQVIHGVLNITIQAAYPYVE